jgi:hypothetical protein
LAKNMLLQLAKIKTAHGEVTVVGNEAGNVM